MNNTHVQPTQNQLKFYVAEEDYRLPIQSIKSTKNPKLSMSEY